MTRAAAPSRPANAGAHRLAWWIGAQADGDAAIARLAREADVPVGTIDRLLCGAIDPSGPVSEAIATTTDGAVRWVDWQVAAGGGWTDAPRPRVGETVA